jgi:hypothetical protein
MIFTGCGINRFLIKTCHPSGGSLVLFVKPDVVADRDTLLLALGFGLDLR